MRTLKARGCYPTMSGDSEIFVLLSGPSLERQTSVFSAATIPASPRWLSMLMGLGIAWYSVRGTVRLLAYGNRTSGLIVLGASPIAGHIHVFN